MHARQARFSSAALRRTVTKLSRSANRRRATRATSTTPVERSCARTTRSPRVMMMIPEAWQNHETMSESKRGLRVPCVSDGAVGRPAFDRLHRRPRDRRDTRRNGLRPSRRSRRRLRLMAAEVGRSSHRAENVEKNRLTPGAVMTTPSRVRSAARRDPGRDGGAAALPPVDRFNLKTSPTCRRRSDVPPA